MRAQLRLKAATLALLLFIALLLCACGGDGEQGIASPTAQPSGELQRPSVSPGEPAQVRTITIGNLTDKTGMAAGGFEPINMALNDMADYHNANGLIPGVKLNVIEYDGQYDPAKDVPGYRWLKERGADVIFTANPSSAVTLRSLVDKDKIVLFSGSAERDALLPPGYVVGLTNYTEDIIYTLLKWVAENDWDYETKGPAKVAGVNWDTAYWSVAFAAAERYAKAHPDQFEWVGGHLTGVIFTWSTEVEAVKEADYVFAPSAPIASFVKEYRAAGCTGKLLGTDVQSAFLGVIHDARLWDELDGALFTRSVEWWNEEGPIAELAKSLVQQYHRGEASSIMRTGSYFAVNQVYQTLEIMKDAAAEAGPENMNSEDIMRAAETFSRMIDGLEMYSLSKTKRTTINYNAIYEARGEEKDIFRVSNWLPIVESP